VSHQLRILRQADLVANRRDGTVLYYRILNRGLEKVIDSAILLEQEKDKQQEEI
jgi:DNA-binding transcriptional ArsR family regulator